MKKGTKNDPVDITVAEWLQELESLNAGNADGLTTQELADLWSVSRETATKRLRRAKKAGMLRVVQVRRESLSGIVKPVPGYVLVRPE